MLGIMVADHGAYFSFNFFKKKGLFPSVLSCLYILMFCLVSSYLGNDINQVLGSNLNLKDTVVLV